MAAELPPPLLARCCAALPLRALPAPARTCRAFREAAEPSFAPWRRWRQPPARHTVPLPPCDTGPRPCSHVRKC